MFDRVTIRSSDQAASERCFTTVLPVLGIEPTRRDDEGLVEWQDFALTQAEDGTSVTRGLHIGFVAPTRALADEFWRAGTAAGYRDDGAPGLRPEYGPDYYGAFLLDPDGNSVEAVHHDDLRRGGAIDHVWMRVADVPASRRFYAALGPHAGFAVATDTPDRVQFQGGSGSFSVLAGTPTENAALRFRAVDHSGTVTIDPDGNTVEIVNPDRPS